MFSDQDLLGLLNATVDVVHTALDAIVDWRPRTDRPGQYALDVTADAAALSVLEPAGVGILSEESGLTNPDRPILVVVDPVDGSTNASRRLPWYATSLCALDRDGPRVAVVANQATGERFDAVRGGGARLDGQPIRPSECRDMNRAVLVLSGYPPAHIGWRQFRVLGAAALDLCAVACGRVDGFLDETNDALGPWDYLGGVLICREAGALVSDVHGRDLVARGHADRRTVVAGATAELHTRLVQERLTRPR
jgi:fructose-1,6-bisphosphatase/inositol monophosphatase family enzyme